MITLNNNQYSILLLDTNALSDFLKDVKNWLNYITDYFPNSIICASAFSLCELSKREDIFDKYLNFFSIWPSGILDGHESIYLKEFEAYGNTNIDISPVVLFPSNFAMNKNITPEQAFRKILELANFKSRTNYWLEPRQDILDGILSLKNNYKPKGEKYTSKEIEEFVFFGTIQQIILRNYDFANNMIKIEKKEIDINQFPSLISTMYVVFYKFYSDNRKAEPSDIIDIIIASILPYVDFVITEGHLCEIIRKVKRRHNFLNNLDYTSIREVKNKIKSVSLRTT